MVAKLNAEAIFYTILTPENVGTAVIYCCIFIILAPGACTINILGAYPRMEHLKGASLG